MDDILIRSLREDELEEMLVLTSTAYNSTVSTFRRIYEHDPFYSFELARVAELNGRLVSYLRAAPRTIWIGPSTVGMGGIAEVCTLQEHRKKGIASRLLREMIPFMAERGYPVSMLYGRPGFYGRLGWERNSVVHAVRVPRTAIPRYGVPGEIRDFEPDDLPEVMKLYDLCYGGRSCSMTRDEKHWKGRILKRTCIRVWDAGGVHGYLALDAREEGPDELKHKVLFVQEAGYRDQEALQAMVDSLQHEEADTVLYIGVPGDQLLSTLSVPGSTINIGWDGMFRVNDVQGALESIKGCLGGFEGRLCLRVGDPIVETNSDSFLIEASGGEVTITRAGCRRWLRLGIREFSQLLPGTFNATQLAAMRRLEYSSKDALLIADALFPQRHPLQPSIDHF